MTKIICPKCGSSNEFAVVVASVFNVYVDGDGKTIAKEPLTEACTGVDRVECTSCHTELLDIGYDLKTEEAFLYEEKYNIYQRYILIKVMRYKTKCDMQLKQNKVPACFFQLYWKIREVESKVGV